MRAMTSEEGCGTLKCNKRQIYEGHTVDEY